MPEFSFEVEKPNGQTTEYLTRGNALTAEEAVARVYDRYPEGDITRQLYGGDVSEVDLSNPNATDSEATGVTHEAEADESESDEGADDADPTTGESDDSSDESETPSTDSPDGDDAEADDESMVPPPIDPAAFTVSDIRSELAERDLSPGQLRGLKVSEEGGEGRVTVIREIDERLADADE